MLLEKISTKVILIDLGLLGVVDKYVIVQFLRKKTCFVTEMCCILSAFIFPDFVCRW